MPTTFTTQVQYINSLTCFVTTEPFYVYFAKSVLDKLTGNVKSLCCSVALFSFLNGYLQCD